MKNLFYILIIAGLAAGLMAQQLPVRANGANAEPPMVRDQDKENQVAKLFETIRADAKMPQLSRIKHRDSLQQQVCTVALNGVLPKNNLGDKSAIFKSLKPESVSTELKQIALFDDFNFKHGSYPRYSVAVWRTRNAQTVEEMYWVGVQRYGSGAEEFIEYHFTDDVFYHDGWKKNVAPECRGK